jgi:hypothetical protein
VKKTGNRTDVETSVRDKDDKSFVATAVLDG